MADYSGLKLQPYGKGYVISGSYAATTAASELLKALGGKWNRSLQAWIFPTNLNLPDQFGNIVRVPTVVQVPTTLPGIVVFDTEYIPPNRAQQSQVNIPSRPLIPQTISVVPSRPLIPQTFRPTQSTQSSSINVVSRPLIPQSTQPIQSTQTVERPMSLRQRYGQTTTAPTVIETSNPNQTGFIEEITVPPGYQVISYQVPILNVGDRVQVQDSPDSYTVVSVGGSQEGIVDRAALATSNLREPIPAAIVSGEWRALVDTIPLVSKF